MNIKDYALKVLAMPTEKRREAVTNLKEGIKYEISWKDSHRNAVNQLISFLESDSTDINDLEKYRPVS